jgi:hypothetical protein
VEDKEDPGVGDDEDCDREIDLLVDVRHVGMVRGRVGW